MHFIIADLAAIVHTLFEQINIQYKYKINYIRHNNLIHKT